MVDFKEFKIYTGIAEISTYSFIIINYNKLKFYASIAEIVAYTLAFISAFLPFCAKGWNKIPFGEFKSGKCSIFLILISAMIVGMSIYKKNYKKNINIIDYIPLYFTFNSIMLTVIIADQNTKLKYGYTLLLICLIAAVIMRILVFLSKHKTQKENEEEVNEESESENGEEVNEESLIQL